MLLNEGKEGAMKHLCGDGDLGIEITQRLHEYCKHVDIWRIYQSDRRATEVEKKRRKGKSDNCRGEYDR